MLRGTWLSPYRETRKGRVWEKRVWEKEEVKWSILTACIAPHNEEAHGFFLRFPFPLPSREGDRHVEQGESVARTR